MVQTFKCFSVKKKKEVQIAYVETHVLFLLSPSKAYVV